MPTAYLSNLENVSLVDKKDRGGVISREGRFRGPEKLVPGPGEYDTHLYKSLSKADFSILTVPDRGSISPRAMQSLSPFS